MALKTDRSVVHDSGRRRGGTPDRRAVRESLHTLNTMIVKMRQDKSEIARLKDDTRRMLDQLSAK